MGNSMSYCVFPSNPAPVILLGLDGAGKTTILYKFLKPHDIVETFPTVGFNREQFTHRHFTMLFWDFGGKPVVRYYYQTSWKNFKSFFKLSWSLVLHIYYLRPTHNIFIITPSSFRSALLYQKLHYSFK